MPCYKPINARLYISGKTCQQVIAFNSGPGEKIKVPCRKCIGCRIDYSRDWAVRCVHEAQMYEDNAFITLTYSEQNVPPDGFLEKQHFQKFMKRLRRHFAPKTIRFYMCGEYGEEFGRPHYHALLFGIDFADKTFHKENHGSRLYTSGLMSFLILD